ncbi:MAG: hypothetical protein R3B13_37545 [Polyangiaceae bacterium]
MNPTGRLSLDNIFVEDVDVRVLGVDHSWSAASSENLTHIPIRLVVLLPFDLIERVQQARDRHRGEALVVDTAKNCLVSGASGLGLPVHADCVGRNRGKPGTCERHLAFYGKVLRNEQAFECKQPRQSTESQQQRVPIITRN